jgi:hypothetical protein
MSAVLDRSSEQETAARHARMAAAALARQARQRALSDAKALIRRYGVRTPEELLALMQCAHASIERPTIDTRLKDARERLIELCVDLDGELNGMGVEE